jgi:hypothetical protein
MQHPTTHINNAVCICKYLNGVVQLRRHHQRTTVAASALLGISSSSAAAAPTPAAVRFPPEMKAFTLIFPLEPLPAAPTLAAAYAKHPAVHQWQFIEGSTGMLVLTRHDYGFPIGVLTELMYFPGKYRVPPRGGTEALCKHSTGASPGNALSSSLKHCDTDTAPANVDADNEDDGDDITMVKVMINGDKDDQAASTTHGEHRNRRCQLRRILSTAGYYSAQRFWVDKQISRIIGRSVWGFPKEMASFVWTDESSVEMKLDNQTLFKASFTGNVLQYHQPVSASHGAHSCDKNSSSSSSSLGGPTSGSTSSPYASLPVGHWMQEVLKSGIMTMQYPLHSCHGLDVISSYLSTDSCANDEPCTRNFQNLTFKRATSVKLAEVCRVQFDDVAFTGQAWLVPAVDTGKGVGFITDCPGAFTFPPRRLIL